MSETYKSNGNGHPSRRQFMQHAGAGAASLALAAGLPLPAEARGRASLAPWRYGKGSYSDDTVLMFRGNPSHTFYGTGPIADKPRLIWRKRLASLRSRLRGKPVTWAGTGWTGTAAKLGDYVFIAGLGGVIYAFEAMTGRVAWTYKAGRMYKGSICIYDNKIYAPNVDDRLRCIDASTGRLIWAHNTGRDLDSSPCVVDGRLYIAGENGHARCLDPQTGKLIWKTFVGGIGPGTVNGSNGSETSPAIADGDLYTANYFGHLYSIDTKTGKVNWRTNTGDDTDASVVVQGEFIYACAEEKSSYLFCFERERGKEIWRYGGNRGGYWSTPAIVENRIYVGGQDGNLHCVDARTGKGIWKYKTRAAIWSSPCVVDGKVVFGSRDAHLYTIDADTGTGISRNRVDGRIISSPCIVDGNIWVGTATGYFYCFGA